MDVLFYKKGEILMHTIMIEINPLLLVVFISTILAFIFVPQIELGKEINKLTKERDYLSKILNETLLNFNEQSSKCVTPLKTSTVRKRCKKSRKNTKRKKTRR